MAVLGLGSAGTELHRFDDHSDLDVFVVVDDGSVDVFVDDQAWLDPLGRRAFSFRNERNGRKVLLADGLFVEYAVFTVDELARLSFTGARTIWARDDARSDLATCGTAPPAPPQDTVAFHLGEALTNLLVGLHRELRGERLTASRFIQTYAVDRVVSLLALSGPGPSGADPFDRTRRVERTWPADVLPLADLVPGYRHNVAAASAVLDLAPVPSRRRPGDRCGDRHADRHRAPVLRALAQPSAGACSTNQRPPFIRSRPRSSSASRHACTRCGVIRR